MARRCRILVLALAAVLLAACDQSPAPAPAPVAKAPPAPPPPVEKPLTRLASEVFVYAYPLVVMDVAKDVATVKSGVNAFVHNRTLPDAATSSTTRPNPDVLFSSAWLDVGKEPVVLTVPDSKGRYYLVALIDGWTNVFSSIGTRTIGTGKQEYAIVGPHWKGTLPKEVSEIRSPTDLVWLLGRIDAHGKADVAVAAKLQDQFKLAPLSKRTAKSGAKASAAAGGVDLKTPPAEQVAHMDARTFFTRFARLLPGNPPTAEDAAMSAKIAKLGVVGGQPFTPDKLDAPSAQAIAEGVKAANAAIALAAKGSLGELKNGWTIQWDLGRYGTDYGRRAVAALHNLGANAPEDAIFASTHLDARGRPLEGTNTYVLHFDKANLPPVQGFWALSMYDEANRLVANPLERYALGSRDKLPTNADGSLDIYLANANPGKEHEANWLPAPKGAFNVVLRLYWPTEDALAKRWTPPAIAPAS